MKRIQKEPVSVEVRTILGELVATIDLKRISVPEWCLNLVMLKEELIQTVVLIGDVKVSIERGNVAQASRALLEIKGKALNITLNTSELEYWCSFFLKYHRDLVAEVDHLDVEADLPDSTQGTVILKVANAVPPMSPEAARTRELAHVLCRGSGHSGS